MSDLKCPLFVDVHVPKRLADSLRALGYDVLTVQQLQGTSEPDVGLSDIRIVEIATERRRAVLTQNAKHLQSIHRTKRDHGGIIICNVTREPAKMAKEL